MNNKLERFWTVRELAERYHCERRSVYYWIESGLLPAVKPVRQWLIRESDVIRLDDIVKAGKCIKDHAACVTLMREMEMEQERQPRRMKT
jgi:excisionase family DNA binding protein